MAVASCVGFLCAYPPTHDNRAAPYAGIIDILQQYDTKKGIETIFKSLFHKKNTISSVNPTQYGDRFKQFMGQITD